MVVICYVPCSSEEEAKRIAKKLLEEKLIACANIHKTSSLYVWKNQLHDEEEWIIVAKTMQKKKDQLKERIKQLHSYELPAILFFSAEAHDAYEEWIKETIEKSPSNI